MDTLAIDHTTISAARRLSNHEVVAEVKRLTQQERGTTVALVAHLSVLDERGLYREEGCSSTYTYCVEILHLSEYAAYARIAAARAAREYPIILRLLDKGSINLTTVTKLRKHLTPENHLAVLEAAKHKRREEVEELVAALRPRPAVPDSIRKLPQPQSSSPTGITKAPTTNLTVNGSSSEPMEVQTAGDALSPALLTLVSPTASLPPSNGSADSGSAAPSSSARRPTVEALAPDCYKVQFTASAETVEKLRHLQDLLRHQIPNGDLGKIMDRAVTVLLEQVVKQKVGATDRPRTGDVPEVNTAEERPTVKKPAGAAASRHIPVEVRRAVWNRDGGQCAFVGSNGHRCTERGFLEFHHKVPYCLGGEATVENIELRCRVHNGYEFERVSESWKDTSVRELGLNQVGFGWSIDPFRPLRC